MKNRKTLLDNMPEKAGDELSVSTPRQSNSARIKAMSSQLKQIEVKLDELRSKIYTIGKISNPDEIKRLTDIYNALNITHSELEKAIIKLSPPTIQHVDHEQTEKLKRAMIKFRDREEAFNRREERRNQQLEAAEIIKDQLDEAHQDAEKLAQQQKDVDFLKTHEFVNIPWEDFVNILGKDSIEVLGEKFVRLIWSNHYLAVPKNDEIEKESGL